MLQSKQQKLDRLAIFPLPNAVLFPGTVLPLHIFEPRYRAMTRDVVKGSQLMAVALLKPGYEQDYGGRPPIHDIAGIGNVIACDPQPGGRYFLLLRGLARVRIEEELPARKAYRMGRARILDDSQTSSPQLLEVHYKQLIALCDLLATKMEVGGDKLRDLLRRTDAPGACADLISALIVTDTGERQRILATLDAGQRLEQAVHRVAELLRAVGATPQSPN